MPSRVDPLRVPRHLDKRIKLTDDNKDEVRRLSREEGLSQRELARRFGVSRRTIQFVLDPAKLEANRKLRDIRGTSYYNRRRHTAQMRDHRAHKEAIHFPQP